MSPIHHNYFTYLLLSTIFIFFSIFNLRVWGFFSPWRLCTAADYILDTVSKAEIALLKVSEATVSVQWKITDVI